MTFDRLLRADLVAMVAAFVLLFVMALDWWTTDVGQEARQEQKISTSRSSARADEAVGDNADAARNLAETQEQNAWQENGLIDRLILLGLLGTVALAIAAAWLRAAARRYEPPRSPSAALAVTAVVTALLLVYRMVQKPGSDEAAVIQAGPPLALILLATIVVAARFAIRAEQDIESPAE